MKILRWIGGGLAGLVLLLAVVAIGARFADGPVGVLPGGALEAGERVEVPEDWSFVEDVEIIEFQLLEPPRSRTVWIVHHEGAAYIPCGMPNLRLWKQWPHEALKDGRSILRIEGRLYEVTVVKVEDPELQRAVAGRVGAKYGVGGDFDEETLWLFRIEG